MGRNAGSALQDVWPKGEKCDFVKDVEWIAPTAIRALNVAIFGQETARTLPISGHLVTLNPIVDSMYPEHALRHRAERITREYIGPDGRKVQFNGQWGKVTFVIGSAAPFDGKHAIVRWYTFIDLHSSGRGHVATAVMDCAFTATLRHAHGNSKSEGHYLRLTVSVKNMRQHHQALSRMNQESVNKAKNLEWIAKNNPFRGGAPQ
jgi:hypothetical protein